MFVRQGIFSSVNACLSSPSRTVGGEEKSGPGDIISSSVIRTQRQSDSGECSKKDLDGSAARRLRAISTVCEEAYLPGSEWSRVFPPLYCATSQVLGVLNCHVGRALKTA